MYLTLIVRVFSYNEACGVAALSLAGPSDAAAATSADAGTSASVATQPATTTATSGTGQDPSSIPSSTQDANLALNTSSANAGPASSSQGADGGTIDKKTELKPNLRELWATGAALRGALGPIWKRVFLVDLLVTTRVHFCDLAPVLGMGLSIVKGCYHDCTQSENKLLHASTC